MRALVVLRGEACRPVDIDNGTLVFVCALRKKGVCDVQGLPFGGHDGTGEDGCRPEATRVRQVSVVREDGRDALLWSLHRPRMRDWVANNSWGRRRDDQPSSSLRKAKSSMAGSTGLCPW